MSTATQRSLRLLPQLPDEITLSILDVLPVTSLLALRQVSQGLRSTVDAASTRLCTVLRQGEEDRIEAICQLLDLKDLSIEQALRLRVERWGKPRGRHYWMESRFLSRQFDSVNTRVVRGFYQSNIFEFLLHLDDVFHDKDAVDPGPISALESISRRSRACCWLEHKAWEHRGKDMTMEVAMSLLKECCGLLHVTLPVETTELLKSEAAEVLEAVRSLRSHPLQTDQISRVEMSLQYAKFRDIALKSGNCYHGIFQPPSLQHPLRWLPRIHQVVEGEELLHRAPAVAIGKLLLSEASRKERGSDAYARLLRVALLEELDVCRLTSVDGGERNFTGTCR